MKIQELLRRSGRYVKDFLLLPIYIRRISEGSERSKPDDPFAESHKSIRDNIVLLNGECANGLIQLEGVNYAIEPVRTIETLNEVVVRRDYGFAWPGGRYVVIDIGMNVGFASINKAKDSNVVHVYGFEPLAPTYELARRNFELNPGLKQKITAYNFGLSDVDEQIDIKFCGNEIMSVSSEGTFDACFWGDVRTETIKVKAAADVLSEIFDRHPGIPVFLKCDCEGAEFKILRSLHKHGLIERISVAIIEWHGNPPDEIIDLLTVNGFSCFSQVISVEWNVGMIRAVRMKHH